ncbi:anti-sigma factor [Sulfobacillus harzensis]|uniref:Anti-sigma factor n=1 Tax=Sulfobacillus harzensis TaxID=2729629 RepID=A0A7Y0Q3F6_9FIRM|nr:anti-sigma factor [Sulfobacillus harzensis]NMP23345.1 anti-sigma factor [Sulfobacillus harzensis]
MGHCEAETLMLRFLSGDLDRAEHDRYLNHLRECEPCRDMSRTGLALMDSLVFQLADASPPRRLWKSLERQVFRRSRRGLWSIPAVAAALGLGLAIGFTWGHGPPAHAKPVADTVVLPLGGVKKEVTGQVVASDAADRITVTVAHLPPPPEGDVYEVWKVSGRGPLVLGTLALRSGHGFLTVKGTLGSGDEVVVCQESQAWKGEWMGPAVLTAAMPGG